MQRIDCWTETPPSIVRANLPNELRLLEHCAVANSWIHSQQTINTSHSQLKPPQKPVIYDAQRSVVCTCGNHYKLRVNVRGSAHAYYYSIVNIKRYTCYKKTSKRELNHVFVLLSCVLC